MHIPTGKTRCYRFTVPDAVNSFAIPSDVSYAVIKNASTLTSVRINFDDDSASNYFTIDPMVITPIIQVIGGKTVNTDGVGGSVVLEIITWG